MKVKHPSKELQSVHRCIGELLLIDVLCIGELLYVVVDHVIHFVHTMCQCLETL